MKVVTIPCLRDNYAYLIICEATRQAGIIDPSEFSPVWKVIQQQGITLVSILNTHHHWDHVGGNQQLLTKLPDLKVVGHHSDRGRIPGQTHYLEGDETINIGQLRGTWTHNPGHTSGAITYYFEEAAFTGDTLFAAGCGRLFEGTPGQMHHSINQVIGSFPDHTQIYFGHEYTQNNLEFAQSVEPGNRWIQTKLEEVRQLRRSGKGTTPSTLESEKLTNPFMRDHSPEIQNTVKQQDPSNNLSPASILRVIRRMKDNY